MGYDELNPETREVPVSLGPLSSSTRRALRQLMLALKRPASHWRSLMRIATAALLLVSGCSTALPSPTSEAVPGVIPPAQTWIGVHVPAD
jgi:hypothetical protein